MPTLTLMVNFQSGIMQDSVQKQIKKEFRIGNSLNVNFGLGVPQGTVQKNIKKTNGIAKYLEVSFLSGIPAEMQQRQISKTFTISDGMTAYFETQYPAYKVYEIWKFVRETIGGPFNEKYYLIRTIEKPFLSVEPLPILPRFRGQSYPSKKRPDYHTIIKQSPSEVAKTYAIWQYARWYIELTYDFLEGDADGSDFRRLLDFFAARKGSLEDFWYKDPDDYKVENQLIAVADGATKSYQLCRTYAGITEPVFGIDAEYPLVLTIGGETQIASQFTINNAGKLILKTVPPEGMEIRASFHFFYRCRFTEDMIEFENFAHRLWNLKSMTMVTTL